MKKIDDLKYERLNFDRYKKRIYELLTRDDLLAMGLQVNNIGTTEYGYNLECWSIGYGEHDIFIVGGTHSSELISVDFVSQLLENVPSLQNFDPNLFKLNIIPMQNPEGFDIASSVLNDIKDEEFTDKSFEYYLRYRADSIIANAIRNLNEFIKGATCSKDIATAQKFLDDFKKFITNNKAWLNLKDKRCLPGIEFFNTSVKEIEMVSNFGDLQLELMKSCNQTIDKCGENNLNDIFLKKFIIQLRNGFGNDTIWEEIKKNNQVKLYQEMFQNSTINNLQNINMERNVKMMYKLYKHPRGSFVSHDSTGIFINLNANSKLNPGLEHIKKNNVIYALGSRNNLRNYFPGPIGMPTRDVYNFEYAKENKALFNLLKNSYENNRYVMTLLYHGTGGLIYYKPYEQLLSKEKYNYFYKFNHSLATIYQQTTDYKILEDADTSGYGDLLRRTFPGVLLIELSKMGGNPIAPYGDKNNIYNTFRDNLIAVDNLFGYLKKNLADDINKRKSLTS